MDKIIINIHSQIGHNIHHQDQEITLHNFKIENIAVTNTANQNNKLPNESFAIKIFNLNRF